MISWKEFKSFTFDQKVKTLFEQGSFVMAIRYYNYKVNLYLLGNTYIEVFVNHKYSSIDRIALLDSSHSRMKFYFDQIKLPSGLNKDIP
ncbi:MAG: hypothetical protein OEU76_01330 [Cyclobacteriaceae bacterium]|nr:hypothetical protein [Cyclobacteriaceae bacterium]